MSKIKGTDVIEAGIFEEFIAGGKEALEVLNQIKEVKKNALSIKKDGIELIKPDSLKNIEKFNDEVKETSKVIGELTKIEAKELELQKELSKLKNDPVYKKQALEVERLRQEKLNLNKATREQVKNELSVKSEYTKQSRILNELRKKYKDVALAKGENSKEAKNLLKQITPLDKKLKQVDKTVGQSQRNVGNYSSALGGLKKILGTLGVAFGISQLISLGKELNVLANESKGVQFAFNKLGEAGIRNFEAVKNATRGTLSNLDIKRSLVEFDNFNISLDQSADLFEFLTVRATQTGVSIDKLKSSLVEGLSKESKLRIDNLGISTKELNEELEKTPNFVQAVSNIARREVAEAGAILDEAGNSQAKWNAQIQNSKENIANNLMPVWNRFVAGALDGISRLSNTWNRFFASDVANFTKDMNKAVKQSVAEFKRYAEDINSSYTELGLEQNKNNKELAEDFLKNEKDKLAKLEKLGKLSNSLRISQAKALGISIKEVEGDNLAKSIGTSQARIKAVRGYAKQEIKIQSEVNKVNLFGSGVRKKTIKSLKKEETQVIKTTDAYEGLFKVLKEGWEEKEYFDDLAEDEDDSKLIIEDIPAKVVDSKVKMYQNLNNIADSFAKRQTERSNNRQKEIENEIAQSQSRADAIRKIAIEGNISAQQSLAIEQKREAEATLKKEREVQKQKRIESGLALLKTYTAELENGKSPLEALGSSALIGTAIASMISAMPSFFEGTENTSRGNLDSKGGFHAILHPDERVVPKKFNDSLDGIANSELPKMADVFLAHKQGLLNNGVVVMNNNTWQSNQEIISKMDELIKVSRTTERYDYNNLSQTLTKQVKAGNSITNISTKKSILWDS